MDEQAWDRPAPGSKMAVFRSATARYITSIAKPDWQSWILEDQFDKFNPAATADPAQLVSKVSPDSGRFDPINPRCPSNYSCYTLQVKR
ncbi:MAG: hypothetical protein ACRD22_14300 [Terriglobia bacterium]